MKASHIFEFILLCCFLQLTPVFCGSDELLNNWNIITSNYANDIQRSNKIYDKIKEEQRALKELRIVVEKHLINNNAVVLSSALHSYNISTNGTKLQELMKAFDENYGNQMIDNIFSQAVGEIILTNPLSMAPELIWNIYQPNDSRSFEFMLRAQMQLYNKLTPKQRRDEKEFIFLFANKLHKIQKNPLYKNIDLSLKLKEQNIIQELPNNLKYLYFMPYFCLQNTKYSTYIYTAIEMKVDPLSRYIWLWRDTRSMDDTGFIRAEVSDLNMENDMKLYVVLKGTKYQMYYYMMPNTMKVAGWDYFDVPLNTIWEVEFLDNDHVAFSQNDYLMCAVENHDNDRRNVGGRKKGELSLMSPECQWRLGQCNFK